MPMLSDCSEIVRLKRNKKGVYTMDYTHTDRRDLARDVLCEEDGWTVILNRGQFNFTVVRSISGLK